MRVTILNPVGVVGGAERVLLAGLSSVPAHRPGFEPTVVLLADGPLRAECERLGARVEVVPLPAALAGFGDTQLRSGRRSLPRLASRALTTLPAALPFLNRLRSILHRTRPQLIHSHGLKTHLATALARPRGVPVLWHLHDFYSERPLAGRLLRRLTSGVAGAIAISEAVKRDAAVVLPGLPVTVVRNAVDTDHFAPAPRDGVELDRLAGLPPVRDVVRVGLVATYANWKGHDVFLDTLARVPGVRGYIIGGPIYQTAGSQWTREELRQRATALGLADRVGFIPFQPDPADIFRSLDIVVHASTRPEPFGLTVAEAMSCGRAVIVSAAGGAVELFTDGHDAIAHRPGDVEGLSAAIARLAGDEELRERLGANARATAVERFGLGRYGSELAVVYGSLS
jgi:glycosyltransferase involved in cell wall biosynthesis